MNFLSFHQLGERKPFEYLLAAGYDHILDVFDESEKGVIELAEERGYQELVDYLQQLRPMEEKREELHQMIRENNFERVQEIVDGEDGNWLIKAKNYYGIE